MSFCPSTRGETECTSASKASAVGGSPSGVPSAVPSTASPVTASGVGRSGTTPLHPSRTTVQRVNPTSSPNPPSPVPRGCSNTASSLSRGVVAAAVVSSMEPTVAAATPSRTGSPATASLPPLPASAAVVAAPHRPSGNQRGAPESTSDTVLLPPLAPTASVLSDGRATATGASFPGGLPSLTPSHVTSSAADVGEREAIHDGAEARRQTGATQETEPLPCSPSSSTALTPTPPSRHTSGAAGTTARPPPPASSSSAAEGAPSPSQPASGPYFRENKVPHLFNELSEALLEARPEDPVAFMTEWLRQRRDALA